MNLKRIAEELDTLGNAQEDQELEETLAACGFNADDEVAPEDDDAVIFGEDAEKEESDELTAMIASVSRESAEKDNFVVEGVNGTTQDEFDQVQGVTENGGGQEDYPSVAACAKKLASIARHLASVKEKMIEQGETARYGKHIATLENTVMKKASILRKALQDKTPFSGDLGHDGPRDEKPYGAYDKSEGEEEFTKRDMDKTEWKQDAHDEVGFGVPKTEGEIPKLASIRLAANKAVRLAVCLLGNKAPEDVVEAQGRDFFASMDPVAIDRSLKRFADTADLYEKKETCASTEVKADITDPTTVAPQAGAEKTVETAANEIAASVPETAAAPAEVAPEAVAKADEPFTTEDEKEIQAMVASIKARKAKIAAEAARRIAEEVVPEVAPEEIPEAPVADEVVEAAAPAVEEVAPEAPVNETIEDEIELTGGSDEADAVVEPELEDIFGEGDAAVTASAKKVSKCVQKLPNPKIASTVESDDLSQLWATDGDEVFK